MAAKKKKKLTKKQIETHREHLRRQVRDAVDEIMLFSELSLEQCRDDLFDLQREIENHIEGLKEDIVNRDRNEGEEKE